MSPEMPQNPPSSSVPRASFSVRLALALLAFACSAVACTPTRQMPKVSCTTASQCPADGKWACVAKVCQLCADGCGSADEDTSAADVDASDDAGLSDAASDTTASDTGASDTATDDSSAVDTTTTDTATSGSCAGICGEYIASDACHCDSGCVDFDDCCADYVELCTDTTDTTDAG